MCGTEFGFGFEEDWDEAMEHFKERMENFREEMKDWKFFGPSFHARHHHHHHPRGFHGPPFWFRKPGWFKDEPDKYILTVPLKGYTKDEVKVKVSEKRIGITLEKEGKEPRTRYFPIPNNVEAEKTTAKFENEELILNLFKKIPDTTIPVD